MPSKPATGKKEGRLARHLRVARQICHEPRSVTTLARGWLLGLWQARGGGFYGLGFVIAFVALEIDMLVTDIGGSSSVSEALLLEALEYVFRIGILSFLNGLLALLWPFILISLLGWWAVALLIGGYIVFEHGLRPLVETRFPELREARERKVARKRARKDEKRDIWGQ
jgi:hypothetical protein